MFKLTMSFSSEPPLFLKLPFHPHDLGNQESHKKFHNKLPSSSRGIAGVEVDHQSLSIPESRDIPLSSVSSEFHATNFIFML